MWGWAFQAHLSWRILNSQVWRQKAGPDDFSRLNQVQHSHQKCQGQTSLETHRLCFLSKSLCCCDIQPRCSAVWQKLSGILWHSWAGNNVRFTNVLTVREHAVGAGPRGGKTWFPWEELCRHRVLRACPLKSSSIPGSQADGFNRDHRACAEPINFLPGHFWEDDKAKT